jgi:hypothetical protein
MMDAEQVLIFEAGRDCHVKVLASPGSGKTKVLIARVRHLLEAHAVNPKRIRVVTFSRQATQGIKARLDGRIKSSTIHSFCLELAEVFEPVVRNGLRHVRDPCALTVEDDEAPGGGMFPAETLVSGAEAEVFVPDEHIFRLLRAFRAGAIDAETAEQVKASVPDYLMIDEFQDTNAVRFEVVRLLVERYGMRVFAVGDKNQTIYGFRDSDPALFDEVDGLGTYPCVTFSLKRNYRSTPAIVGFRNDVCPEGEAGRMVAAREAGPATVLPKLAVFEERGDESTYVAAAVMALREAGEDDVAVMARTQKDAYAMAHKLSELKVPASIFMGDSEGSRPKKRRASKRDGPAPVFVCTIHAAKGLEWKHVFLVGCSDAINRCLTGKELEQELNLFYVACSRAKDALVLTSPTKCIMRLLFKVHESRYEIDRGSERTIAPMFGYFGDSETQMTTHRSVTHFVRYATGEFFDWAKMDGLLPRGFPGATIERLHAVHVFPYASDLNVLYASAVERVIYRQILSACFGRDVPVRMIDHFANRCFLWVRGFQSRWNGPEITEEDVETAVAAKAAEFGLADASAVEVHYEAKRLPAYLRGGGATRDRESGKKARRFDGAVERIRGSCVRYINDVHHDTDSREALRAIADVAVCAHLAYPPAKTHFVFEDLHLGDLRRDKNLGLFGCTRKVAAALVREHGRSPPEGTELPRVFTPEAMMRLYGVGVDVDLSTRSLRGMADIIMGDLLIDIKTSAEPGIQATWVLQLLCYAALARLRGMVVNHIAIYNALSGTFWKAPVGDWRADEELLVRINEELSRGRPEIA